MKKGRKRIDWDKMTVTYVLADPKNPNPNNPYAHMTHEQRRKEIIKLAAKIWRRHCAEVLEQKEDKQRNIHGKSKIMM